MPLRPDLGSTARTLYDAVACYRDQPHAALRFFRDYAAADPAALVEASLRLFRESPPSPGLSALATFLNAQNLLLPVLLDPRRCSPMEAAELAQCLGQVDANFDVELLNYVSQGDVTAPENQNRLLRSLEILPSTSNQHRLLPTFLRLLHHPCPRIRSKLVLLVGRTKQELHWIYPYVHDIDPRVRANAVESVWGGQDQHVRRIFQEAAGDEVSRVIANALVGMALLKEPDAIARIEALARHPLGGHQASAAWAMGRSGCRAFIPSLQRLARSPDPGVRKSALRALLNIRQTWQAHQSCPSCSEGYCLAELAAILKESGLDLQSVR